MTSALLLGQRFALELAPPVLGQAFWAAALGVPIGIIALYFLKLRRRPVQVPSTLLWKRSLEDLHVNSLFQRLRRNLLLFLQLLVAALALFALLGPITKGTAVQGQRFVITIDESASMAATDVEPSRMEAAKREARRVIDQMRPDDLAMIIAFSDSARVVSSYTANKDLLRRRLDSIVPTQKTTSLREALQVAAGLANPSKQIGEGVVATSVVPPKLLIYTDGGFADVEGFSLGNLEPEVIVVGTPPPPVEETAPGSTIESSAIPGNPSNNVAVLALQAARNEEKPDQFQIFGRVRNYRDEPVETEAKLLRHDPEKPGQPGILVDAVALEIEPRSDQSFSFDLADQTGGIELEVRIDLDDDLPIDNRAYTVFGEAKRSRVLLVTSRNRYLTDTLTTPAVERLAEVTRILPEELSSDVVKREVAAGRYDLVIYDGVRPEAPPEANTLYFGVYPPGPEFEKIKEVETPVILDWNMAHPLLQYIRDLTLIKIGKAVIGEPPKGSVNLIDSDQGPLAWIAPRSGFVDTVIGFKLLDAGEFNTDWPIRFFSFPLFLYNTLRVLGGAQDSSGSEVHMPGQPVTLRADSLAQKVDVTAPDGKTKETIDRSTQGTFTFNSASTSGIYHARWEKEQGSAVSRGSVSLASDHARWETDQGSAFAVNLFDERESDLATRGLVPPGVPEAEAEKYRIKIGHSTVAGTSRTAPAIQEWWRLLAMIALGVLLLEWFIYNRRVYI